MRKDKIIELRIEEDDLISGIDSISLVDEPAIEINWVAFNKEKQHEFDIPDLEDSKYSSMILSKGQPEDDLLADGWVIDNKQDFVSSSPNDPSFEDTDEVLIRYKYVLNPETSGNPIRETTRDFCRDLLNKNFVYRVEDLDTIVNDQGSSALVWRGGYNCRHKWQQIRYRRDVTIINKGSVTRGRIDGEESYDVIGYPQPDTRVPSHPSFAKTKREENFEVGVPHYTKDGKLYKGPTHKDADGKLMTGAVHTEDSEYLYHIDDLGYDNNLPNFVDPGIKKKKKNEEDFQSYRDYPEGAVNNAKRAVKWAEENGWGSCGTAVGKQRAHQLATRQSISEETIARMASFARHRQHRDVPYSEGCGGLMWDAWGGTAGIEWAQRKLDQIENARNRNQKFAIESEEKRIVVGPAMVPDLRIFRKDKNNNPYHVFFSEDTIRMIAEKYMRFKYVDNNDENHNGKALKDVYVIESWIKEDDNDKSTKYGYESLPVGTWFVSMKIRSDEVWQKIKRGELRGYSVSGYFEEIEQFAREEMFLKQLAELLKNVKE